MPVLHRVIPDQQLVYTWSTGIVGDRDLALARLALQHDPAFDPTFDQLVECRNDTVSAVTSSAVMQAVEETIFAPQSRRAFAAESDVSFGMARMFASLSPVSAQVRAFRGVAPALEWLGRPAGILAGIRPPVPRNDPIDSAR